MSKSKKASGKKKSSKPNRPHPADRRKRRLITFVLVFLGLLAVGAILYPFLSIAFDSQLKGFMAITASICGGILHLFSADVTVTGRYVTFQGFSVEIIEECTGIFEMLIFLAALISYPASWRSKLIGFLLGIPTLYAFNVIRIAFLSFVGARYHKLFDFMHLYFWQATLILMITTVWVLWILLVVGREKKTTEIFS
jgi:exosortase H (IPTLxxWG-CTERM-specific)